LSKRIDKSFSRWIEVCKENCKRFIKVKSNKNVSSQLVSGKLSEKTIKKERKQTYKANDKIAYLNKINHPNYNPFSPLFKADDKGKSRTATMADDLARKRFLAAMNGDYNDDIPQQTTTTINSNHVNELETRMVNDTTDEMIQEDIQVQPSTEGKPSDKNSTNDNAEFLVQTSDRYAPQNLT
jgi:hypothetical protein